MTQDNATNDESSDQSTGGADPIPVRPGTGLRLLVDNTVYEIKSKHPLGEDTPDSDHCTDITLRPYPNGGIARRDHPNVELQFASEGHRETVATVPDVDYHPCEKLNYDGLFETLLRGADTLAERGEYDLAEELAATALGVRSDLARCSRTEADEGR